MVPGLDTPENLKKAQQAIESSRRFWTRIRNDVNSMKQIAGIDFQIKKLDDAKTWQKKVLAEDPKDPEAAYSDRRDRLDPSTRACTLHALTPRGQR